MNQEERILLQVTEKSRKKNMHMCSHYAYTHHICVGQLSSLHFSQQLTVVNLII